MTSSKGFRVACHFNFSFVCEVSLAYHLKWAEGTKVGPLYGMSINHMILHDVIVWSMYWASLGSESLLTQSWYRPRGWFGPDIATCCYLGWYGPNTATCYYIICMMYVVILGSSLTFILIVYVWWSIPYDVGLYLILTNPCLILLWLC